MDPLVSVVIPTYNNAAHVADAVRSVLDQTYANRQVIVVDDGSTDDTPAVLASFRDRVRCVRKKNEGAAAARNMGVHLAQGSYVAFLDADDLWAPTKLREQVDVLLASPEFPVVHADSAVIDASGNVVKESAAPGRQTKNGKVFRQFFLCPISLILTSTVLIRKDCFDKVGLFDPRYPVFQDYDFFLRLAWEYPVYYLARPLASYRLSPGSLTRTDIQRNVQEQQQILEAFIAERSAYFASHPRLLRRKWRRFHFDSAMALFHHEAYAESHARFARCLSNRPRAWPYWLLTCLPPPLLRVLRTARARP